MLSDDLHIRAIKRFHSTDPLVYNDPQGVLVACGTRPALNLLWSHIGHRANNHSYR